MLQRKHASIPVLLPLCLTVLVTSTAIVAIHHPSALPSFSLQRCRKTLWTGTNCSHHECSNIQRNYERRWFKRRQLHRRHPSKIPRGGDQQQHETENSASQQHQMIPLSSLPIIDAKSVSLALRLTCETNRRLHHGTSIAAGAVTDFLSVQPCDVVRRDQQHVIPSSFTHTIPSVLETEQIEERRLEELTVFHCVQLGDRMRNGWHGNFTESQHQLKQMPRGPDLNSFLETLLCSVGAEKDSRPVSSNSSSSTRTITTKPPMEDEAQVILALTMLYLDRSTSSNSPLHLNSLTGQQGYPQCPHILPQTVHRLLLTALSIAFKYVRGDKSVSNILREVANSMLDERHAISLNDMEKMEDWMLHAISSTMHATQHYHEMTWQISHDEISRLLRRWGGTFYPQRLAAHDLIRMEQQERFWREQSGTNHGHGNFWSDARSGSMEDPTTQDGQDQQWQYPGYH